MTWGAIYTAAKLGGFFFFVVVGTALAVRLAGGNGDAPK